MPTLDVVDTHKKKVGTIDLSDAVFAAEVNVPLVHQVIKAQLAGRRQGTAKVKTKAEVRGGGRKPFRQKGTGNARQGSTRSPLHPGGGQAHGPQPRSYEQRTPKEMVRGALRSALSDRVNEKRVLIVDEFNLSAPKTKPFAELMAKNLQLTNTLIVDDANRNLELSGRNIPRLKVLRTEGLNVYDIVKYENLVLTKRAAEAIDARLGKAPAEKAKAAPKTKAAKAPRAKTEVKHA